MIADLAYFLPFAVAVLVGLWGSHIFRSRPFPVIVDAIIGLIGGCLAIFPVAHYIDQNNITFGSDSTDDLFYSAVAAVGAFLLLLIARQIAVRRSA
ncbi:MAG TPA: hypothetical protein VG271_04760 [Beijerinckiaceae bacterium]|nr:hypothetical protein [Beijerinckiaceae bacterium]